MKTRLTSVLMLISSYTFSQDLPDLKKYSKDIGFNTSVLLNGIINSSGSPFDLMLKKQRTSNTATRFGMSLYADINTNTSTGSNSYYQYNNYRMSISVGKEKQNQLSKRWIFYYGGDLAPFYQFNKRRYYNSNKLQDENGDTEIGLRVSPFLGIRFQINERLYLGTEALLRLSYSFKEASWKSYNGFNNDYTKNNESFNNLHAQAIPATGVFIFYRF